MGDLVPHAALRDLGFSREGEMKTLSQGRTARLRAAVDRYQAIRMSTIRIGNR